MAEDKTDDYMDRVKAHANPVWVDQFMVALGAVARWNKNFVTADVVKRQKAIYLKQYATTHEPRAIGAMMQRGQKEGLCKPTHRWLSGTGSHGRPQRVWESQVFHQ